MLDGVQRGPTTVRVGICAMEKKTGSKPMRSILQRLEAFKAAAAEGEPGTPEFEFIIFSNDTILNSPIEEWPLCDCLCSWFSHGFPLDKAIAYAELRKPFLINDLEKQKSVLMDRRQVYQVLKENEIPVSRYVVMSREPGSTDELVEDEDWIEVNGVRIHKPFVEKPVDAEDHNVYIYYPMSAGGGSKRLFRKINDRSSANYPDHHDVRTEGTYIYEEFLRTEGTDIKVYTVGNNYAHAEARKSPVLDGRVNRAVDGTEVRFPVVLTMEEKVFARKIVEAFGQTVCGFDLLRTATGSFVCDVNGWSFVKKSTKYYDDCAATMRLLMLAAVAPWVLRPVVGATLSDSPAAGERPPGDLGTSESDQALDELAPGDQEPEEELRCVVVVARHGDRNPKQKLKVKVRHPLFIEIFERFGKGKCAKKEAKLKQIKSMQHLTEVVRAVLKDAAVSDDTAVQCISEEERDRLVQVRAALERHAFSGINRKAQLKPLKWASAEDAAASGDGDGAVVEGQIMEAMLVMKWGGELTPAGRMQAEELGQRLRKSVYVPYTRTDDYGAGLLRLHSTYRHDFKVYSSDEGRVMMSAAAFTKGLLALEGSLTPILVSLVHRDEAMLDESHAAESTITKSKTLVKKLMVGDPSAHYDDSSAATIGAEVAGEPLPKKTVGAMVRIGSPRAKLERAYILIGNVLDEIRTKIVDEGEDLTGHAAVYNHEKVSIMFGRWVKLHRDFYSQKHGFDLSKVPDLYDCVKFDAIHNAKVKLPSIPELFYIAKELADFVIPQEYGVTQADKKDTSRKIGQNMFRVMAHHLQWARKEQKEYTAEEEEDKEPPVEGNSLYAQLDSSYHRAGDSLLQDILTPERQVRTRIYMTSESHVHALLNLLRFATTRDGSPLLPEKARQFLDSEPELNFLNYFVFKVFERPDKALRVEIRFSAGANENPMDFYHEADSPLPTNTTAGAPVDKMDLAADSLRASSDAALPTAQSFPQVSKETQAAVAALDGPQALVGGAELKAALALGRSAAPGDATATRKFADRSNSLPSLSMPDDAEPEPEPEPEPETEPETESFSMNSGGKTFAVRRDSPSPPEGLHVEVDASGVPMPHSPKVQPTPPPLLEGRRGSADQVKGDGHPESGIPEADIKSAL